MPVKLNSSGGGSITLDVPSMTTANTLTLPAKTGNIITSADSGTVTPAMLSQKLTLETAKNSTSGTNIDFTGIPSWVKRVTIMFNGVSLSGSANFLVQIGTGGTPTTSGYTAGATALASVAITQATSTTGFPVFSSLSDRQTNGALTLVNISGNIWVASGVFYNTVTTAFSTVCAGNGSLAGALDMIRITTTSTDTFDAGSINVLYEG